MLRPVNSYKHKIVLAFMSLMMLTVLTGFDWPQFNQDAQHRGNNVHEVNINAGNVSQLAQLFKVSLPDYADGPPVYLSSASTISGTRSVLFVTTISGHIVELDALTGQQIWAHQYGPNGCVSPSGVCLTTSSPALDPNRQYVYSYGLDGFVHKYAVYDGSETLTNGWPETATLKDNVEKGSSPLSVATARNGSSYLYVTNSGYFGDGGNYQGHLTAINLLDGSQHVFNTLCSNQTFHFTLANNPCPEVMSGVWARSGVVYSPATDRIYLATGNAAYNPALHDWGDTVLALHPDGTGVAGDPVDTYTPADYQSLQNNDLDLGSTNVAILPVPVTSTLQHVAVQSGKDGVLRLLNLDNLSGQGGPGHTGGEVLSPLSLVPSGEVLTAPAVWVNPVDGRTWIYVAINSGLAAVQLTFTPENTPTLSEIWHKTRVGTSPIIANNILYLASSNYLQALDPVTGSPSGPLWHTTLIGGVHWQSPILANGVLYVADNSGALLAFSLGGLPPVIFSAYLPLVMR